MKFDSKHLLSVLLFLLIVGSLIQANPVAIKAQNSGNSITVNNPLGSSTFQDLVKRIADYLFQIGLPIAVIMILYSAFLYVTAGGSDEKITRAHKTLIYALVGVAILSLAWGLVSLVKQLLGVQ